MSLTDHTNKIVFMKDYFMAEDREYLLVHGSTSSGKFYIVNQAYNILDDNVKSNLYVTIIRNDTPISYGEKTAPRRKCVLIRDELDAVSMNFINGWTAEVVELLPDPVHILHTIRNYDTILRKWLRLIKVDSTDLGSPILDLIPLRDEYLKIDYDKYVTNVITYNYGLKNQTVAVTFAGSTISFSGFSKTYSLISAE
jgi:hypothetical protein